MHVTLQLTEHAAVVELVCWLCARLVGVPCSEIKN
jgi:hypothetical protein